jgi:mono/diheme cytochrome c family protein
MQTDLIVKRRCRTLSPTAWAVALAFAVAAAPAASSAEAPDLYKSKCAACHGPDGSGDTAIGKKMKAPDLRSDAVQKKSDAELTTAIANGKGAMPGFGKSLKKEQIGDLMTYVRELATKR